VLGRPDDGTSIEDRDVHTRRMVVAEPVPVGVEAPGHGLHAVQVDSQAKQHLQGPVQVWVVEQAVHDGRPPLAESDLGSHFINYGDKRWDSGSDRIAAYQAQGE